MIAALPMYDRAETAAAHDALWSLIRDAHGGDLPLALTRGMAPAATWAHPELALGQICGLPLRTRFRGKVLYVGSGTYDIDAPPGHYRSVWVVHADDGRERLADFAGACLAYTDTDSQSGWAAPLTAAADAGIRLGSFHRTGGHRRSAAAVAAGQADIAALDAVSWRGIVRHDRCAGRLRSIGATPPTPGLAFVAARGGDVERMFDAVAAAVDALAAEHRDSLGLRGIVRLPLEAYAAVPTPSRPGWRRRTT